MAKLKDEQQGKQNNLCVGLVAHVDAGKTTLAEAMLYLSGTVKGARSKRPGYSAFSPR